MTYPVRVMLLVVLVLGDTPAGHAASAASAERLKQLLGTRGAEAIAAEDPEEAGLFVAALLLQGQLLAVAARCNNAEYLRRQLEEQKFRDLYIDLHGCAIPATKFFVQDMGADGLRPQPESGAAPDIVYEKVSRVILLNGDWRKQDLDEKGYLSLFQTLDARYEQMLQRLIAAIDG